MDELMKIEQRLRVLHRESLPGQGHHICLMDQQAWPCETRHLLSELGQIRQELVEQSKQANRFAELLREARMNAKKVWYLKEGELAEVRQELIEANQQNERLRGAADEVHAWLCNTHCGLDEHVEPCLHLAMALDGGEEEKA